MKRIEKRVVDDPRNNIATRQLAIKQAKRMRNGAKTNKEKRDIEELINRLENEIQAILDKQNETPDKDTDKQSKTPRKQDKTPEEVKAILDRLNEIQKKFTP